MSKKTFYPKDQSIDILLKSHQYKELEKLISEEIKIPPRLAVIGKAGVGKTTTINNLFDVDWKISHTTTGTIKSQIEDFNLSGGGKLSVIDMPGLGEDIDTDNEYENLYREILPTVDVILWVLQANTKDIADDERILSDIVEKSVKRLNHIVIGLNQVDKIGPGGWDEKLNIPSKEQEKSIQIRSNDIIIKLKRKLNKTIKITYYSALRRYRLYDLLISIINAAGEIGWKLPIQPKDPWELAAPEVQEYVKKFQ
jgi:small GTP-binding protein